MSTEIDLATRIADAIREGRNDIDPAPYAQLDIAASLRVQALVQRQLGETVRFAKVAVPKGVPMGTPIFRSMCHESQTATVSTRLVVGIEVEVAAVLGRDLTSADAARGEAAVREAIDHYVVGIELIGSRFTDRLKAGLIGELADNLSTAGYVTDPARRWERGPDVTGADVEITHNGLTIYAAPAKHVFGSVLASLVAYAAHQSESLPLKAGMIVTTGTLVVWSSFQVRGRSRRASPIRASTSGSSDRSTWTCKKHHGRRVECTSWKAATHRKALNL